MQMFVVRRRQNLTYNPPKLQNDTGRTKPKYNYGNAAILLYSSRRCTNMHSHTRVRMVNDTIARTHVRTYKYIDDFGMVKTLQSMTPNENRLLIRDPGRRGHSRANDISRSKHSEGTRNILHHSVRDVYGSRDSDGD